MNLSKLKGSGTEVTIMGDETMKVRLAILMVSDPSSLFSISVSQSVSSSMVLLRNKNAFSAICRCRATLKIINNSISFGSKITKKYQKIFFN